MLGNLLLPEIEDMIAAKEFRQLKEAVSELPEADIAELISDLGEDDLVVVFRLLPKDLATDVFEHLEFPEQEKLLHSLRSHTIRDILEEMSPDDRTALLEELPPKVAREFIAMLSPEERQIAQRLLNYPEDSIGRRMTPDFVYVKESSTAEEALSKIRRLGIDRETVYVIYVCDERLKLLGLLDLKRLVTAPLDSRTGDLMEDIVGSLNVDMDQEEATDLLRKYDAIALPVTDREGRLVGIVTFDDVMDIVEEEHDEDVQLQAAIVPTDESYLQSSAFGLIKRRIVWLIALLVAETGGVLILKRYEGILESQIALALFLPVMIATGGNTGTQSAALIIRAIATGAVELKDSIQVLVREFAVSFGLCAILGIISYFLVLALERDATTALCIGVGLAAIVTMSNLAGAILPLVCERIKIDPALMSGPFISTLIDVVGLVIYLEISKVIFGV